MNGMMNEKNITRWGEARPILGAARQRNTVLSIMKRKAPTYIALGN